MYRYSERLNWNAPANPGSQLLSVIRSSGTPVLDLSISNPTEAFSDYPHAEIAAALGSIPDFRYHPDPFGSLEARAVIAQRIHLASGISVHPAHIALTASTSEAYSLLFKLLADPGDEVLVPTPSYPLFDFLAQLENIKLIPYRLAFDGSWHIDFSSLESAASPRARAIILVNPNNPTGSFLKQAEFTRLQEFANSRSLPLISDEVFADYPFAPGKASTGRDSAPPNERGTSADLGAGRESVVLRNSSDQRVTTLAGSQSTLAFALNGVSKSAGMPQMKLGWITIAGPPAERDQACRRLELVLDTYLSVSAPAQLAAAQLLAIGDRFRTRILQRIQNNLATLRATLGNQPVHMLSAEGGWSAILRVPQILSEDEWITRLLRDHNVIAQPGYFFDIPGEAFLVVSLLCREQDFSQGIAHILALANSL